MSMRVYLMRHAETGPRPGKPSDGNSIGIVPSARKEVLKKGKWLKARGVRIIITSPLTRARETAEALATTSGARVTVDPRATEFVAADVEAPGFKVARDKARLERDWAGERGESFRASIARFKELLGSVVRDTAIVSHELLMQNLLMHLDATRTPTHIEPLTALVLEDGRDGWRLVATIPGRSIWQRLAHRVFR